MKYLLGNTGYFFKEARLTIRMSLFSNLISLVSMALIFFILAMVLAGRQAGNHIIKAIEGEAEISVYYTEGLSDSAVLQLAGEIMGIDGVKSVQLVDEDEAYARMEEVLGKEARVLEYFADNPFSPFIEIRINLDKTDQILQEIQTLQEIEYIRDNREVLGRLRDLAGIIRLVGFFIISAVGVTTLIIISHIIRLGIDNNREQIKTLILLGAPDSFIAWPFVLAGLLLSVGGAVLASALSAYALSYIYGRVASPLPFIPLPPLNTLILNIVLVIICLGAVLGLAGSVIGLRTAASSN